MASFASVAVSFEQVTQEQQVIAQKVSECHGFGLRTARPQPLLLLQHNLHILQAQDRLSGKKAPKPAKKQAANGSDDDAEDENDGEEGLDLFQLKVGDGFS